MLATNFNETRRVSAVTQTSLPGTIVVIQNQNDNKPSYLKLFLVFAAIASLIGVGIIIVLVAFSEDSSIDYENMGVCMHTGLKGNGRCDDESNSEVCEFDGGDCCLPNTEINDEACVTCMCYMSIDLDDLFDGLRVLKFASYEIKDKDEVSEKKIQLEFEKVQDDLVCSKLCFDRMSSAEKYNAWMYLESEKRINAWLYNPATFKCECLLIHKFYKYSAISKETSGLPLLYVKKEDIIKHTESTVDIRLTTPSKYE